MSAGLTQKEEFTNGQEIWSPIDNPSTLANRRQQEMFPSMSGFIGLLFEVGDPETQDNIITVDSFREINTFYD
jgi:hypothetical protein